MVPWAHSSPYPKWHLDWFSHFCRAHDRYGPTDQPKDRFHYFICNNRSHLASAAMQPNNNRYIHMACSSANKAQYCDVNSINRIKMQKNYVAKRNLNLYVTGLRHYNIRCPLWAVHRWMYTSDTTTTTTTVLWPFFRDHPGEPMPEENFWTLWCEGRLTEADTLTIRLGATPSGLTSAHLHHPPICTHLIHAEQILIKFTFAQILEFGAHFWHYEKSAPTTMYALSATNQRQS